MIEIRLHGRGGQGAFTAARLLGHAAAICDGRYAQAFPSFGPERRGAPVLAFTRISDERIYDRSEVVNCDYCMVLDETLFGEPVLNGLRENALVVINSARPAGDFPCNGRRVFTIDATKMALDILKRPIVNVPMLAAFSAVSGITGIEALLDAVDAQLPPSLRAKNKELMRYAFNEAAKKGV